MMTAIAKVVNYDHIGQEHMDQYFSHGDPSFKRYQYVISESGIVISETKSLFNTRRYRELISGLL